jgi:L-methionine (R)-S-oxide reductase
MASLNNSTSETYRVVQQAAVALFEGERNVIANAANLCALLWDGLADLNWVGFYFWSGHDLVLGPFQGKVACVRIELSRGVCGHAATRRKTEIVADVHAFAGHIACDSRSRSEIVVPLLLGDRLLGVLDLDSPRLGRFDVEDAAGLESVANIWVQASDHG